MNFGAESEANAVVEGVDLQGKIALITGASGGIGLETARALLRAGAEVVLANRDSTRSEQALAQLRDERPDAAVSAGVLDLTSLAGVRAFAESFGAQHSRLDLLVNNAGVMATPLQYTADGFELQFGTNHIGHFLLTNLLLPLMSAPARIVNLSSNGHRIRDMRWEDPNWASDYSPWPAYGQSKTANVLFSVELERRLGSRGIHAYAVHPGVVTTDLFRYLSTDDRAALDSRITQGGTAYKTPQQGAATSVWAATAPELTARGGSYLEDCRISDEVMPYALDPAAAQRLWTLSEELVGQRFTP
jgi:NAD(P)-dependent dehydrogenase (short-subunit alcohol dehydrogenase family)